MGHVDGWNELPRLGKPWELRLYFTTQANGFHLASPEVYIGDDSMTLEQAEALADGLRRMVELARGTMPPDPQDAVDRAGRGLVA